MSKKSSPKNTEKQTDIEHLEMMGDGTGGKNLDQRGNPAARIKQDELDAAFAKKPPKKS